MAALGSSHFHPTTVSLRGRQPKLLDRVREAIRTRHYSYRTEKAYIHWIKRFLFFQQAAPGRDGRAGDRHVFVQLARRVSASTQNHALNAILKNRL
ncbi:MAG: phage integrase N-terminal SAM-like domain-containing protein [Candidatus Tectomicrobia bacterium]|uniref:Phage integrase N-terminal SAM-like domain-containing protein n=1 Tax=Tectimicrobiota bacterium TaxID=2528274 RepID=A0A932GN19_UNCTE|nr:phage integrase N-terminal SAM-like domain-containing protein [Candidatus Tectomicrobia bacterium]